MEKSSRKSVLPVPEPARNFAVRGISALIAPVVRPAFQRRAPAAYLILADWEMLAGPDISAAARPVKLAGGTLTLACSGPVAMDLQYRSQILIDRLNTGLGGDRIERLRFIPDASATLPARLRKPANRQFEPPASLPKGPLGEALAQLYQSVARRDE